MAKRKLTHEEMSMAMSECAGPGLGWCGYGGSELACLYQAGLNVSDSNEIRLECGYKYNLFDAWVVKKGGTCHDPDALLAWADKNGLVKR